MKWIGALLLLAATTWVGFEVARKFKQRPRQIKQWKHALQMLEAEMVYGQTPLLEACKYLSKQMQDPISWFFRDLASAKNTSGLDFSQLWEKELDRHWGYTSLGENEKEILKQFGQTLGQQDLLHQKKQVQLALSHLDRELEDALGIYHQYNKTVKGLGFLTGLLIVLLLI
ncbi:stage III sporulation protein AB [Thalassobacillus cyri]|uniref:Stage III sporulation protein AB n=1 Tax=Thalassobacillus cyri TaxID=571932 RepID=A0A1H4GT94_9BACI|nr:stage III sporulation protein SpoIIIAB [Thalassobacillus cyri]SEB12795.1 stage III sporulation protein AB [Thalassobacillus cyri]